MDSKVKTRHYVKSSNSVLSNEKPNVFVFLKNDLWGPIYTLDGWFQHRFHELERTGYNVIFVGSEQSRPGTNWIKFRRKEILEDVLRAKDSSDHHGENAKFFRGVFSEIFPTDVHVPFAHILTGNSFCVLPLRKYGSKKTPAAVNDCYNEFGDQVNDCNAERAQPIIEYTNEFLISKVLSPTGFSVVEKYIMFSCWDFVCNRYNPETSSYIYDPGCFYHGFERGQLKHTHYYFADDTRGTRNFKRFPFDYYQHTVYDNWRDSKGYSNEPAVDIFSLDEAAINPGILFAGSILHDKGTRITKWSQFLKSLTNAHSKFVIPIRLNGVNKRILVDPEQEKRARSKHPSILKEIESHPLFSPGVLPDEIRAETKRYRYSLILACVSMCDSLNFRPMQCAIYGILPLLDPDYDPDYLQIPEHIQQQIRVSSSEDIEERIQYFESHPEERDDLIDQLQKYMLELI